MKREILYMAIYQATVDRKLKGKSDKSAFEDTHNRVLPQEKKQSCPLRKPTSFPTGSGEEASMTCLRRTSRTGALHCHNIPTSIMKISHLLQNLDCEEVASLIKKVCILGLQPYMFPL